MGIEPVDIIVPVYNEELAVVKETIRSIHRAFNKHPGKYQVIIVNDGSKPSFGLEALREESDITLCEHEVNRGYGRALKTGILAGSAPWIAITDADGTYPVNELPKLVELMQGQDMVIGVRTGPINNIPLLRRFPKKLLNLSASYMAGVPICDLNSGMRVFTRPLCYYLWPLFPSGFSFTSTITMGAHMSGFRVKERPINYFKREGHSSIKPIQDTVRFFRLVARLGLIFDPMKLFAPVAIALFCIGIVKGFYFDFSSQGYIGNFSLLTIIGAIQITMMGLLGKLIVHSRLVGTIHTNPSVPIGEKGEALREHSISHARAVGE